MRRKTIPFDGTDGAAEMMVALLKYFADVAYPLGGSDCAAASREALQKIADTIITAQEREDMADIPRRQRALLKSAITWFYTDSEYAEPNDPMYARLLSQFER